MTEVKRRREGFDLFHQTVDQFLAGADRHRWDIVNRLFRVQFGALAARLVENIDKLAGKVQEPQLENREQATRAGADNDYIAFLRVLGHGGTFLGGGALRDQLAS